MSTTIEWTDETWNPTTGCTKISPGCANCYIERTPAFRIAGRKFDGRGRIPLQLHAHRLETPLHWKKPRRVFVNSLSDLFHDDVPDAFILQVLDVIRRCPQHTFQLLTKRAGRMRALMSVLRFDHAGAGRMFLAEASSLNRQGQPISFAPLIKNLWLGVSVENQHFADERVPQLLQTPAAVRFISAEPLLEAVDLNRIQNPIDKFHASALQGQHDDNFYQFDASLDWVIVGGESGPGARPFDLAWARSIVEQCKAAGVPVFVKQLGAKPIDSSHGILYCANEPHATKCNAVVLHDKKGGDPAEWPEDLRVREFPHSTWNVSATVGEP